MRWLHTLALAAVVGIPAAAQNVVSAKAGLVHYTEGDVLVAGKPVEKQVGLFTTLKPGESLSTTQGRAEVLLGPGVFLRVGEKSTIKLVANDPVDTKLELVAGTIIIEAAETVKDNRTTIIHEGVSLWPKKDGVYTIETEPELQARTWDGELAVEEDGKITTVKGGRVFAINTDDKPEKFDKDNTDSLYRWASRRSSYIAMANVSGARNAERWGITGGGSSWLFNSYLGMYTFMPYRGIWNSPFGWAFYSPASVWNAYYYPPVYGGWRGGGGSSGPSWSPTYNPNLGYNTIPMRMPSGVSMGGGGGGGISAAPSAAPARGAVGGGTIGRSGGGGGGGRGR